MFGFMRDINEVCAGSFSLELCLETQKFSLKSLKLSSNSVVVNF